MKNIIKAKIIVFAAVISFSLVSCGDKIDSGLEGTWKGENNDFNIKISKSNFSINDEKKGDEVITKNDIITVKLAGKEVGKAGYVINLSVLSFSGGTGIFIDDLPPGGKYIK
jgi:uncharacterized lipoprotein YehR (DUF1307 family)